MPRFIKNPIIVEATRLTSYLSLDGKQGTINGQPGDWLVTGIEGEQYVVPHSRFVRLYKPDPDDPAAVECWERAKEGV